MSKRHEGNSIIVTGAAGAIGFATSEILAREGARVMMVDINEGGLAERVQAAMPRRRSAPSAKWMVSSTMPGSKAPWRRRTNMTWRCSTRCCT
jgi:NAD(P)-dependent dehydrogenase (short-subunit alcohol dehydrogenase family)